MLATWLVLWLMYMLLPNTRVSVRMSAVGSFVAALLWVIALQLFTVYVQRAAITTLYGALALLPLFLLAPRLYDTAKAVSWRIAHYGPLPHH